MSIRSVRSSSANWRSCVLVQLAQVFRQVDLVQQRGLGIGDVHAPKNLFFETAKQAQAVSMPFADFRAARAQHDFFQPAFGGFQFLFAMGLQRLSAFVQGDGIFQIHLALLQARDNGFQLLEGRLEAQSSNGWPALWRIARE